MNTERRRSDPRRAPAAGDSGKARVRSTESRGSALVARPFRKRSPRCLGLGAKTAIVVVMAVILLGSIFYLNSTSSGSRAGAFPYVVALPGVGAVAPPIHLEATDGSTFDLAALRGQSVLLFFQEGIGCEPCWTQMKDIQANIGQFQTLGVSRMVMITTDDKGALQQKVADEGIALSVLSDPRFAVSLQYHANQYGMMGTSADGHTFVLVGKDGKIAWRADYGGPPNYTMYVPVPNLLADLRAGLKTAGGRVGA